MIKFNLVMKCLFCMIFFLSFSNLFSAVSSDVSSYRIVSGDVLSINILPANEFSRDVVVAADGTIDFPLIGTLKISGLSVMEVEKLITERLSKYVSNPVVNVTIKMYSGYKVAILGCISKSGYYPYRENMNILELIAEAGGLCDYADTKRIKIYRKIKDEKGRIKDSVVDVSIDDLFKIKPEGFCILEPGDVVYVPKQKFTTKSRWIADNLVPWITLTTFFISIGIILGR